MNVESFRCTICGGIHVHEVGGPLFCPETTDILARKMWVDPTSDERQVASAIRELGSYASDRERGELARLLTWGGRPSPGLANALWRKRMFVVTHDVSGELKCHIGKGVKLHLYNVTASLAGAVATVTLNELSGEDALKYVEYAYPASEGWELTVKEVR
jgi:hypothetical protein